MVMSILILVFISVILWGYVIVNRKYYYKSVLINAVPMASSLVEYQNGISKIKDALNLKYNNAYDRFYFDFYKKEIDLRFLPYYWLSYRLFNYKGFAINQVAVTFISSYGNISEVSRRKFSDGNAINELQEKMEMLVFSIRENNVSRMINCMADIYRDMYGTFGESTVGCMKINVLYKEIEGLTSLMKKCDIVNSYVYWRNLENKISKMGDIEVVIYGAVRLRLEKYIISYRYPVCSDIILSDLRTFEQILVALKYWIDFSIDDGVLHFKYIKNAGLFYTMDMLGCVLEYK